MNNLIGQTIRHYKITELIGQGGMGVVYKAHDIKLNRQVALKFLPLFYSGDEEAKKRFIHEAQSASALDHPNICTIHEIEETNEGQLFIVMSCYDGESLKDKIERGPLPISDAVNIIRQICDGLEKAHKKDIIHRDIKPANLFITNDEIVKILDFGLAKVKGQTRLTQLGTTAGTVEYMSPEQARGEEVDQRTDIWAVGVILYEMLTGVKPFRADYAQAVIYSIINGGFESVKSFRTGIPEELESIIQKALEKDPGMRYQSISEIKDELSSLESGKKIISHPQKGKKLPVILTSLTILIIAFIIVLFYPKETIPFAKRDWILIADFENQTGQQIFDKSLYTAFTLSIDQSRYVNVVSRRRIMDYLKRMEKSNLNFLDEQTVHEMAIREGINIYLVPGISKIGNKYVITCKIEHSENGEILKSEIQYAGENDILEKLDELSKNIREDLGETGIEFTKQDKPLRDVTTSSLAALKQYSLGIEEHWKSNFKQARDYYENALRIDSNFVSAKASLGNLLLEKFDRERGKKLLKVAIKSLDKVTEKEKYGILAFYAVNVEGNFEKGIKYTKIRTELYPDDPTPHNNLGWYFQSTGKFKDAVREYKTALKIDPHLMLTYGGIIWTYLEKLGEIDSAFVWTKKMLKYDDKNPWTYFYLGSVYVAMDSLSKSEYNYKKAMEINPEFIINMYRLAHVYRLQNKYQKAIDILQKILNIDNKEYSAHYDMGINYNNLGSNRQAMGQFAVFKKTAEQWVKENPKDPDSYYSLSAVLARMGEIKSSWKHGQNAMRLDTTMHLRTAEIMALHGRKAEALGYLKKAINAGYKDFVWLRLDVDLENINNEPAFKKILREKYN